MEQEESAQQFSVDTVCRTCLDYLQSRNAFNLFDTTELAKKLIVCTSLSVELHDEFPKNICHKCYNRLNDLADFQKMCVDSVQKFLEILEQQNSENKALFLLENNYGDTQTLEEKSAEQVNKQNEDDNQNDPLLNHKMEITNEEEVFKLLENVDKESAKPSDCDEEKHDPFDEDFSSESSMSDVQFPSADEVNSDDSSEDDIPLAKRAIQKSSSKVKKLSKKSAGAAKEKRKWAKKTFLEQPIECHICHQKFKQTFLYEQHMKYHNDELPHQCKVESCLKGFTTARYVPFLFTKIFY